MLEDFFYPSVMVSGSFSLSHMYEYRTKKRERLAKEKKQ